MKTTQNFPERIRAIGFSYLPLGLLFFLTTTAHAGITEVRDIDTPGEDSVLHIGGLAENVSGFVDRGENQNWINVPESLVGADYIESAQNNADVSDDRGTSLLIEVDVTEGTVLYMFIHDAQPSTPFPWMNDADFGSDWVDTGRDVFYAFNNTHFDIWRTVGPLHAGTYNFRQMPVDSSFYGIAATDAQGCGEPVVSLGEVMAGFQAGFTGGARTVTGLPEGLFAAFGSDERRGFVAPETGIFSEQCDNDYILVTAFFASGTTLRTRKEAKETVKTGFNGLIPDFHFLIDGDRVEHMETAAKFGRLPGRGDSTFAILTAGHIVEPFTLSPGLHTATSVFDQDFDRDGVIDLQFSITAEFTIIDSAAP